MVINIPIIISGKFKIVQTLQNYHILEGMYIISFYEYEKRLEIYNNFTDLNEIVEILTEEWKAKNE